MATDWESLSDEALEEALNTAPAEDLGALVAELENRGGDAVEILKDLVESGRHEAAIFAVHHPLLCANSKMRALREYPFRTKEEIAGVYATFPERHWPGLTEALRKNPTEVSRETAAAVEEHLRLRARLNALATKGSEDAQALQKSLKKAGIFPTGELVEQVRRYLGSQGG